MVVETLTEPVLDVDFRCVNVSSLAAISGGGVVTHPSSGLHLPTPSSFAELEFDWPNGDSETGLSVGVWFRIADT